MSDTKSNREGASSIAVDGDVGRSSPAVKDAEGRHSDGQYSQTSSCTAIFTINSVMLSSFSRLKSGIDLPHNDKQLHAFPGRKPV